jgi:hypothetical protein
MKKAAEVDFTWAASREPMNTALAHRPPGDGLEILGLRHTFGSRVSGGIVIVVTAKQTISTGQRRKRRRPFRGRYWLTNDPHDDVTLSLTIVTVKIFFRDFAKAAFPLVHAWPASGRLTGGPARDAENG